MVGTGLEGRKILLVEDEFLIALELSDSLSALGALVSGPHATLAAAKAAAQAIEVDLAILDIDLRGEEVFPAALCLRERGIPFIFYTGQPDRDILRLEFADVPVCIKPADTQTIVSALSGLLAMAA